MLNMFRLRASKQAQQTQVDNLKWLGHKYVETAFEMPKKSIFPRGSGKPRSTVSEEGRPS